MHGLKSICFLLQTQQQSSTRDFVRNASARSSNLSGTPSGGGGGQAAPPPRPYKSPDLYANTRSFKTNPMNQVLPSPGGSLPTQTTSTNNQTSYATVMSNSRVM